MRCRLSTKNFRHMLDRLKGISPEAVYLSVQGARVHAIALTRPAFYGRKYDLAADLSEPLLDSAPEEGCTAVFDAKTFPRVKDIRTAGGEDIELDAAPGGQLTVRQYKNGAVLSAFSVAPCDPTSELARDCELAVLPLGLNAEAEFFVEVTPKDCELLALALRHAMSLKEAKDARRDEFAGILVTPQQFVATDGCRLVVAPFNEAPWSKDESLAAIMPPVLAKFIADGEPGVLEAAAGKFSYTGDSFTIVCYAIPGEYPDFTRVIPDPRSFTTTCDLDTKAVLNTLNALQAGMKRPRLMLRGAGLTCLEISGRAKTPIKREARLTTTDPANNSLPDAINLQCNFLTDALFNYSEDTFRFQTIDADSPILVTRFDGARVVIMPIA